MQRDCRRIVKSAITVGGNEGILASVALSRSVVGVKKSGIHESFEARVELIGGFTGVGTRVSEHVAADQVKGRAGAIQTCGPRPSLALQAAASSSRGGAACSGYLVFLVHLEWAAAGARAPAILGVASTEFGGYQRRKCGPAGAAELPGLINIAPRVVPPILRATRARTERTLHGTDLHTIERSYDR